MNNITSIKNYNSLAEDIEGLAAAREVAGCDVVRVCYDDSEHVDHLRQHRETYITNIDAFIRKCLADKKQENAED